ncbi:MAG: NYN domain-containing protein [Planctomycetes bacterium]|nr:NYN domain-containing protein [Planctomycetota bacterium]
MNGLHLFIDNSNVFIEGQRVARETFHYDDQLVLRFRVSYGGLLDFVQEGRPLKEAVLVGSRPPPNDALWNRLEALGIEPRIFERSFYTGREKRVDAELTNAIRDTLEENPDSGTIALVAGDADYVPVLERCLKKAWAVEIYFWAQASRELLRLPGVKFSDLADGFKEITFLEKQMP